MWIFRCECTTCSEFRNKETRRDQRRGEEGIPEEWVVDACAMKKSVGKVDKGFNQERE